ncbi:unnamed protein product [Adineta steineri]|uniref:F5/8 type C domain-containing protein n=1 Tax=Adineta steineri TaxID=433720 RepID=A0A815MXF6_9BILA|nr:unnamed protein product [Adineta steineri]
MNLRHEDQQRRQQLLTIVDRGNAEQLFSFLQQFHRKPFRSLAEVIAFDAVIDDQIDFIDCTGTKYNVTPLIIASGKGSYEKTKILLVHGANPNKQCATGDTALNLAVHRQKYHIADLLLKYHANPNVPNQSGKTALHRAAVSYIDENANHIRALLYAGGDPTIEDRNQRTPLDEAVVSNKPEIVNALLSHDRTLTQRAYRAAIIAARLGYDKCLEALLDYGMDPNITDRTRTTPLHIAIRSLKLSTARLLVSHGADQNMTNNRGETPLGIAEYLQTDQKQSFINVLANTPRVGPSDYRRYTTSTSHANVIPYVHPLLRSHPNWTLDSEEFRSNTDINSSVQNLLDTSNGTFWCCTQNKDAWVIFDLKHQFNISGMRIIGCENQSTPKTGHIDVSNAFNGPWLKVKDFTCPLSQANKNDLFFAPLKTRFIRVFISDNYGGNDIRIQGIGFYGVDMRLVNALREYGLERSLQTLLANGINDLETLDEKRDEILNSSDKYLDVNDHFQFIRLTDSLRAPTLTFLEWFNSPQSMVIAGEKLQTFSAASDEGLTNRVQLEEKLENNTNIRTVLLRDLEPIQGRSLVDFPDYVINDPGKYKVRVVSVESPEIQTPWQDIIVGKNNHTKDDNDILIYDYPLGGKVKYLTPRKYRVTQRAQLPNVFPTTNIEDENELNAGDYTLTPSKYRMNKINQDNTYINEQSKQESHENIRQNINELIENNESVVIGDFILTKKPVEDKSIYSYKPKHTHTSYIYKGTLDASEVQERAKNNIQEIIKQRSRSSSPNRIHERNVDLHTPPIPSNNDSKFDFSSNMVPSTTHSHTSTIDQKNIYYFGEKSGSFSTNHDEDISNESQLCVLFNRPVHDTLIIKNPPRSISTHSINDNNKNFIVQEVIDIGTSTDDFLLDATSDDQTRTISKQLSLLTNRSSRTEAETYRVNNTNMEHENYEDYSVNPLSIVKHPGSLSSSYTTTDRPYINLKESTIYEIEDKNMNQGNYYVNDDGSSRSSARPSAGIQNLSRNNPLAREPPSEYQGYGGNNYQPDPTSKPTTLPSKTSDSQQGISSNTTIHRPISTTPTDLDDDEVVGITTVFNNRSQRFPRTPRPYRRNSFDDSKEEEDENSDAMQRRGDNNTSKTSVQKAKLIDESTQSEEKSTRSIGIMHEPVKTKNFGNEAQPQSSATQTSFSLKEKPSKARFTYIERSEQRKTPIDELYTDSQMSPRLRYPLREDIAYPRYEKVPYECSTRRSPLTTNYPYDEQQPYNHTEYNDHVDHHHHSPSPTSYRPTSTTLYRSRTPSPQRQPYIPTQLPQRRPYTPTQSPQRRTHTPSPTHQLRGPSPQRRPRSNVPRRRPQMRSQETDTSLDAMKHRQNAGVQYEPRSTKEIGTTPSLRTKTQTTNYHSKPLNTSIYSQQNYPTTSPSSKHHDLSQNNFHIQSKTTDNYRNYYRKEEEEEEEEYEEEEDDDEEKSPSMHDKSTMAELTVSFDHYTQCDSQPFMADRYIQTTPTEDKQGNMYEYVEQPDIRQLPRRTSTYIPQPVIIQPDTLPRIRRAQHSPTRPKRDGLDYTGGILEVSLQHGHVQRTTPISETPLLNIGTENIILHSSTDEYTIPFEIRYPHDSFPSRSRNSPYIIPVHDSPRTRIVNSSAVRQSQNNGNFFLTTAPSRPSNSSVHIDIATDEY